MTHHPFYKDTIEYLFALQKHGIKLGLANSVQILSRLGNPHEKFRTVHVAGTNGKGSTSAFIAAMLEAAGYRVGLYTSPHLVDFCERIRINGVQVPEAEVVELAGRVREECRSLIAADGSGPVQPTFFEVTTAIAFLYFARHKVDIAVIEVGMGGRCDSTNVISPLVSVITNIDIEHTEFLGGTLERIAGEKAGIIKQGTPVVTAATQPEVLAVFGREADAKGTRVFCLGREFSVSAGGASHEGQAFSYHGRSTVYGELSIRLLGGHQVENAGLALAAVEFLRDAGMAVDEAAVRTGLDRARWQGRMERMARRPDIYLDGAHNPASARRLAALVRELLPGYGKLVLIIGILGDKDYQAIVNELVPLAAKVVATRPRYARALDVGTLCRVIRKQHGAVVSADSVDDAIVIAREEAAPGDLILVTGSLYVVGDARACLGRASGKGGALRDLTG